MRFFYIPLALAGLEVFFFRGPRMEHSQSQIVTNASMAADITSKTIGLNLFYGYAVQANYTTSGSLGGTLALQASVDHREDLNGNVLVAGNFVTIAGSPQVLTGAGSFIWNVGPSLAMYSYFRLIYTHAGGDTGSLNAFTTIKGL